MEKALHSKYRKMRQRRGPEYRPRTHHLDADGWARYTNRLFLETSPYLLQHAHNPVDWYPWGEAAFARAREADIPILVSIGYSTCHWCHVMEAESFEDEEIAQTINANFVAIKIDREERPDVDSIYMQALQAMGLGGGWPLNVWLTPDLEPFFGGTYFPARDGDRPGATGFLTVLKSLKAYYDDSRDKVADTARAVSAHLESLSRATVTGGLPGEEILHNAVDLFRKIYDPVNGGVRGAPKFPSSLPVRLLLRYYRRSGDQTVLDMAVATLEKMAAGGMYDHVAGGFHRYATDERWLVPHFEKMLYDNALLVPAYLEGFQVTRKPQFKEVAVQILDYVLEEMCSIEGAFFSATDADSIGPSGELDEGYFFTWTPDEVRALLDTETADAVMAYYAMSTAGNFEGRNILHTPLAARRVAENLGLTVEQLNQKITRAKAVLWKERNKRALPIRDEKVLAAWNGLMVSALARAGFTLDRPDYTAAAEKAAHFILNNLVRDKRLHRSWTDGVVGSHGFMEDYAFVTAGFIDLYEATFDTAWLRRALDFDRQAAELFEDEQGGGFFTSSILHSNLIIREKSAHDNAVPSGNSVAAANLLRLAAYTGEGKYRTRAESLFKAFASGINESPAAFSEMLLAVDTYTDNPHEIVIALGGGSESDRADVMESVRETFLPNRVIFSGRRGALEAAARTIPCLTGKEATDAKVTVFLCDQAGCRPPVFSGKAVAEEIKRVATFKRNR